MRLNRIALAMAILTLTALMIPLAFAQEQHSLNIYSLETPGPGAPPLPGVPFTIDGAIQVTPYSATLDEGTHTIVMPSTVTVDETTYNFAWWETGSTDPTRTIDLTHDMSIYAHYEVACVPSGESPGYWKRQVIGYVEERGRVHEDIIALTEKIDDWWQKNGDALPDDWDAYLVPVSWLDVATVTVFSINDPYTIFTDKTWKTLWKPLANWYNWAADLGPYLD